MDLEWHLLWRAVAISAGLYVAAGACAEELLLKRRAGKDKPSVLMRLLWIVFWPFLVVACFVSPRFRASLWGTMREWAKAEARRDKGGAALNAEAPTPTDRTDAASAPERGEE